MGRRDPLPRETLVGVSVLVIDDDAEARDLLATVLGYCGALVTGAGSAETGLAIVERLTPDVVVCDIAMHEHDGYWFLTRLRAHASRVGTDIPVIAVTGYEHVHTPERTLSAGFDAHVRKPVDPWELSRLVSSLSRGRA